MVKWTSKHWTNAIIDVLVLNVLQNWNSTKTQKYLNHPQHFDSNKYAVYYSLKAINCSQLCLSFWYSPLNFYFFFLIKTQLGIFFSKWKEIDRWRRVISLDGDSFFLATFVHLHSFPVNKFKRLNKKRKLSNGRYKHGTGTCDSLDYFFYSCKEE